jgi:hypothetical protein
MVSVFRSVHLSFCLLLGFAALPRLAGESAPADDSREIENLAAFARVYGYVRFFCPSDVATQVDWDRLAILGAEEVRGAPDTGALQSALLRVFQPIGPGLQLAGRLPMQNAPKETGSDTDRLTFWQYQGVNLGGKPGVYQQIRTVMGATVDTRKPLFESAIAPALLARQLTPDLALTMPTALSVQGDGTTVNDQAAGFEELQARLAGIDLKAAAATDWRVRVGGVVTVWNVFQHFHPYLDGEGVRWEDVLRPALGRALRAATAEDYYDLLSEMIAQSHDGHGYVYAPHDGQGGLPLSVAFVENQIMVTGADVDVPLQRGDVIRSVDGADALEVLRDRERITAGSSHLRRFRGLNQFGEGPVDRPARIEIVRGGEGGTTVIEVPRNPKKRGYFFKQIGQPVAPGFAEVRPGIYYVNLYALTGDELAAKQAELAGARGIIFDWRWLGHRPGNRAERALQVHVDIIPHLIEQPIQASPMLIPQITTPDRSGWNYRESTWPVKPKAPRFKGQVVFINEPSVVSYGETCMAMIAHYRLATLVGAATAGCNGNANYIELPAGFRVMWTGMDVRKHDRSPFYGVGFRPDVPVTRTLQGVREGRDEYLEAAIGFLENAAKQP